MPLSVISGSCPLVYTMPRRRAITGTQLEALLALPTAEPDLIRHYGRN